MGHETVPCALWREAMLMSSPSDRDASLFGRHEDN